MRIDIEKLKDKYIQLKKEINNYENIELNYCNILNSVSNDWNDSNMLSLLKNADNTKKKIIYNIENIKRVIEVFNFIIMKYSKIGNTITYDKNISDKTIKKNNLLCSKIDSIIKKYQTLYISKVEIKEIVLEQIKKLTDAKKELISIKEKSNNIISDISEIELQASNLLSNLDLVSIHNEEYEKITTNVENIKMDIDRIEKSTKKLMMYQKEEDLSIEKIRKKFTELITYYKSKNNKKINNIIDISIENMKTISLIHKDNISKIEKSKNDYINKAQHTKNEFIKLGDNIGR